jgi:NAD(P)-dependent dehydrogenase (short-subunit alcohol dehydrogenase family)
VTSGGKKCVVTGASSGIGRALALRLAREGADVWALGRDAGRLAEVAEAGDGRIVSVAADLGDESALVGAARAILSGSDSVDILAHCAGVIARGPIQAATVDELDRLYDVTLRGPFVLTQALLPALKVSGGQVVFINSLVSPRGANDAVLYAALKQAARTFADGLRQEVNADGIRVVTVAPGRTDTAMQEWVHEYEGRDYDPNLLLSPDDVVGVVLSALAVGPRGEVTDVSLRTVTNFGASRP